MAVVSNPNQSSSTYEQTLEHITTIFKSLPSRPTIEDFEEISSIVTALVLVAKEETNLEHISNRVSPDDLPSELFSLLHAMKKLMAAGDGYEQRNETTELIEIHETFRRLEELIRRAESGVAQMEELKNWDDPAAEIDQKSGVSDGILMKMMEVEELKGNSLQDLVTAAGRGRTEKLSLLKVAALFESYAKAGASVLDLKSRLKDQVEWLPLSLGKLLNLIEINISDNQILALPFNLGELKALRKLDIHSNQLINLPGSTGDLVNLTELDLHANRLKSLPTSFGSLMGLVSLDLSSNLFVNLPDSIGNLSSLERLNLESNDLEELPCTIGSCTSLLELRLDFNRLKAIPASIGNLERLKILTLRYNRVKNLPTAMGNLQNLEELNLSFNELESIPESLCSIMSLRKLNVGGNFVDLTALPRSIGNLEMLEELDISNDQIRVLPDSFRFLSRLRVFHAEETPLEVPPRHITELGAQAVVQYMAGKRSSTFTDKLRNKRHGFWSCILSLFCLDEILSTESN